MNLRLRPDVTTTETEHGTVLLDERNGRYWQLNHTGTHVLQALLAGHAVDQIATDLTEHHHAGIDRVHRDITAITEHLRSANLVVTA
jgi:hypothetical protein